MPDNTTSSATAPAQSSDDERPKPWPLHPPSLPDPSTYPKVSFESLKLRGTIPAEADGPIYFEGAEHERIAAALVLYDPDGTPLAPGKDPLWKVHYDNKEPIALSFGRIIALAGDHFTNLSDKNRSPICGAFFGQETSEAAMEARFTSMVDSMKYDKEGFLPALDGLIECEKKAVDIVERSSSSVKQAFHQHTCGIPTDKQFWDAASYGSNPLKDPIAFEKSVDNFGFMLSLYAWASYINADHFGGDAITAYAVGHGIALKLARQAASEKTFEEKRKKLMEAYLYDAFAAHFLTDLFSAGHLRVPRRQLHCKHSDTMAKTKFSLGMIFGQDTKEVPIWDHQNRYMHDDDSATGLLVRNKKGHEWIAYGDKQFLESANAVNRQRAQHALQASVDELFYHGFQETRVLRTKEDYAALQLVPQPMVAIKDAPWVSAWGGYDMHNPAPLWLAMSDEEPECSSWTRRANINDHSNFARATGFPGSVDELWPKATTEAIAIQDAPFRGIDQFVSGNTLTNLKTGGFLQIQDLKPGMVNPNLGNDSRTCVNVWSPACVKLDRTQTDTFTLRNRIVDLPSNQNTVPLHWTKWVGNAGTSLVRFGLAVDSGDIVVSRYGLDRSKQQLTTLDDPNTPWAVTLSESAPEICDAVVFPSDSAADKSRKKNLVRFVLGKLLKTASDNNPDIVCVSFGTKGVVRVAVVGTEDGMTSPKPPQILNLDQAPSPLTFVKRFVREKGMNDSIVIASVSNISKDHRNVSLDLSFVAAQPDGTLVNNIFQINCPKKKETELQDISLMVGDAFGSGNDQFVLMSAPNVEKQRITVFGFDSAQSNLVCIGTHACSLPDTTETSNGMAFVRTYITALIPTASTKLKPRQGLDVISISSYKNNALGKHQLIFRTHIRNANTTGEKSNPWGGCKESDLVDDTLADMGLAYKHIKWLRCQNKDKTNSSDMMEIFSLYGVLGVRLFRRNNTGNYYDAGQTPYLGQNCIGAGTGAYGDAGHGFQTWGDNEDFVDVNAWVPKVDAETATEGAWGMTPEDAKRRHIRGWEVDVDHN